MKKGFNLIELMVVIAIIAILASIALPMYSGYKRRTAVNNCLKGISQIGQAIQAHITDIYDNGDPSADFGTLAVSNLGQVTGTITKTSGTSTVQLGQIGICGALDPTTIPTRGTQAAGGFTIEASSGIITGSGCATSADCGFSWCVVCPINNGSPTCATVVVALGANDPYNVASTSNENIATSCP